MNIEYLLDARHYLMTLYVFTELIQANEIGTILQMRNLRHRGVK
jgi:hypothetical protein